MAAAAYRGVSATQPIAQAQTRDYTTASPYQLPSVDVNAPAATIVVLFGHVYSGTSPPQRSGPASVTKREDQGSAAIFDGAAGMGSFNPGVFAVSDSENDTLVDVIVLQPQ